MIEFIPINLRIHKSILLDLNEEYLNWVADEIKTHYNLDLVSILGEPIRNYAENKFEELTSYKPPNGIFYVLQVEDSIVGMGAIKKLNKHTGEVKRMYIRQDFRRKGFGKDLLKKLLNKGREFGCTRMLLDTGKFMTAAQRVYRSSGFKETKKHPETEVPLEMQPYWIFMEMRL